jgi:hypothetical protein
MTVPEGGLDGSLRHRQGCTPAGLWANHRDVSLRAPGHTVRKGVAQALSGVTRRAVGYAREVRGLFSLCPGSKAEMPNVKAAVGHIVRVRAQDS